MKNYCKKILFTKAAQCWTDVNRSWTRKAVFNFTCRKKANTVPCLRSKCCQNLHPTPFYAWLSTHLPYTFVTVVGWLILKYDLKNLPRWLLASHSNLTYYTWYIIWFGFRPHFPLVYTPPNTGHCPLRNTCTNKSVLQGSES